MRGRPATTGPCDQPRHRALQRAGTPSPAIRSLDASVRKSTPDRGSICVHSSARIFCDRDRETAGGVIQTRSDKRCATKDKEFALLRARPPTRCAARRRSRPAFAGVCRRPAFAGWQGRPGSGYARVDRPGVACGETPQPRYVCAAAAMMRRLAQGRFAVTWCISQAFVANLVANFVESNPSAAGPAARPGRFLFVASILPIPRPRDSLRQGSRQGRRGDASGIAATQFPRISREGPLVQVRFGLRKVAFEIDCRPLTPVSRY